MILKSELNKAPLFDNLQLLARQVVEGYISGIHKSPFHGYSAEFAEHKIYNPGESTKHIDWKLFARTDKLYTKRYEEETNLRCHLILDNSASMYYPQVPRLDLDHLNKMGFAVLAAAALMELLKKQRDAVGLSVFSDTYAYYAGEKGSERHYQMLLAALSEVGQSQGDSRKTELPTYLHQIAEKLKRRSLVALFTDMFQDNAQDEELFEALRHLKYNKHDVILFHLTDKATEIAFDFENSPRRFTDVESGATIDLFPEQVRRQYQEHMAAYIEELKQVCAKYQIKYSGVDIAQPFARVFNTFLVERQRFT
ncbi:Protein of unknown function DUF58 [Robiginitalea myxolifaciens]|uniref:DUF58 domain-containing protein n=1 Tax=Robiginitalea myxolifaciens TaxID=400055 RepID=A0A1I6FV90_9FLAO|nr:DUF58 domain-containing protein [Robiginitalea myxolifaciens]SFR33831.1 Protein of unknown function DUF58 [Robiginitalea myxolifaciens]